MSTRRFTVTGVAGHCDIASLDDLGPRYVEVLATAENAYGETITFRRPIDDQPRVGDIVAFDENSEGAE